MKYLKLNKSEQKNLIEELSMINREINNLQEKLKWEICSFEEKRKYQQIIFEYSLEFRKKVYHFGFHIVYENLFGKDQVLTNAQSSISSLGIDIPNTTQASHYEKVDCAKMEMVFVYYNEENLEKKFGDIITKINDKDITKAEKILMIDTTTYLLKDAKLKSSILGKNKMKNINGFRNNDNLNKNKLIAELSKADISDEVLLSTEKDLYDYAVNVIENHTLINLKFNSKLSFCETIATYFDTSNIIESQLLLDVDKKYECHSIIHYISKINSLKFSNLQTNKQKILN